MLLLNYEFPPVGGGAGNATLQIGRELVSRGVGVHVLTTFVEAEKDGADLHGMRVWRVPSWRKSIHECGFLGAYSWAAFAVLKRIQLLRRFEYDLEHYFFSLPTGILSLLPPLPRRKLPYVVSLRGSDVRGYDPFNVTLARMHSLLLPVNREIWRRAGRVVALSEALREIALASSPDQEIHVIPNGIDVDAFRPPPEGRPPLAGRLPRLLTVSRLLERKGIHHLLRALAEPTPLPVSLDIIGCGSYEEKLKRSCAELGLGDRVRFLGLVRRGELPRHYQGADLFVLPSQTESFGLVFAEAMATGLPVLATRVGGIPELVRDGEDGVLVTPGGPGRLREALTRLLSDDERRLAMGRSARARILQSFTWDKVARQYLDCYRSVLAEGANAAERTS